MYSQNRDKDGKFGKDPNMRVTKRQTSIPEEVFGKKGLLGYIDKNGEWKKGFLRTKRENGIDYIALSSELKPESDWSKSKRAISLDDYIKSQIMSCKKVGEGYYYDVFYRSISI